MYEIAIMINVNVLLLFSRTCGVCTVCVIYPQVRSVTMMLVYVQNVIMVVPHHMGRAMTQQNCICVETVVSSSLPSVPYTHTLKASPITLRKKL